MNRDPNCSFCKHDFPYAYQLVSDAPEFWLFISNKNPHTDYHCLIVLKATKVDEIGHISDIGDIRLPDRAMKEFGVLLKNACIAIKDCDHEVEKIFLVSLNSGEGTKHLHVHLIPKKRGEFVRTVNNPCEDGGGMLFLARKEIVAGTFSELLKFTTGDMNEELICKVEEATRKRVTDNTLRLRDKFSWNLVCK